MERLPARAVSVPIDRRRLFQGFAILGAVSAYATIVLGGTVRGMDAGLACPDWPLCHGSAVPDLGRADVAVEYAHRLVAAFTSLFILLTMILAFLWFRSDRRLVTVSFMTFALLVAQIAFGAFTITSELDVAVVTAHLAVGTATLAFAVMVALFSLRSGGGGVAEAAATP